MAKKPNIKAGQKFKRFIVIIWENQNILDFKTADEALEYVEDYGLTEEMVEIFDLVEQRTKPFTVNHEPDYRFL